MYLMRSLCCLFGGDVAWKNLSRLKRLSEVTRLAQKATLAKRKRS